MAYWTSKPGEDDRPRQVDEDDGFRHSAAHVIREFFAGDEEAFNAYLNPVTTWALCVNAEATGKPVKGSSTLRLVDVERPPGPRLQVYFAIAGDTCWRKWVQVDPAWAAVHAPLADLTIP